jgi:hypothetical protein
VHPKSSKNIQENPNPKNAMNKPKAKKKHEADRIDEATFLWVSELWSSFLSPIAIFFAFIICGEWKLYISPLKNHSFSIRYLTRCIKHK